MPLRELVTKPISYGIVQAGPDFQGEGSVPYIKSSDLNTEQIIPEQLCRTSPEIAHKYRRSEVVPGDIVFSLRGNLGAVRIVPEELTRANLTQGTARIAVDSAKASAAYVLIALRSQVVRKQIESVQKGSTFQEISLGALRELLVPLVSPGKQERIVSHFQQIEKQRVAASDLLITQRSVKQALLNHLFSA